MHRELWSAALIVLCGAQVFAQGFEDELYHYDGAAAPGYGYSGYGDQMYRYDDQEPWKHGYIQTVPFYGGYHSFLPYNYKQVYSQAQAARGWGEPEGMPYAHQFYHRHQAAADLTRDVTDTERQAYEAELSRLRGQLNGRPAPAPPALRPMHYAVPADRPVQQRQWPVQQNQAPVYGGASAPQSSAMQHYLQQGGSYGPALQ